LRDGNAEAEQADFNVAEGFFGGGEIQKILVSESAKLGIGLHQRPAGNSADFVDDGGGEARFQDGSAGGARGTEEKDFHEGEVYRRKGEIAKCPLREFFLLRDEDER
jgi:hypothetical protein